MSISANYYFLQFFRVVLVLVLLPTGMLFQAEFLPSHQITPPRQD
jgi:hypothetical protein